MFATGAALCVLVMAYWVLYLYRRRGDSLQDQVTGLPNRDYFERYLQNCIARAVRRPSYGFGVLLLDIRGFGELRKELGRFAAEEILADFAERVFWCIRPSDVLSRLEGDNFAIVLEETRRVADVARVALRVQASMHEATTLIASDVQVRVNIGVTVSRRGETPDVAAMINEAEQALTRAIDSDRPYVVFNEAQDKQAIFELALERDLVAAIAARRLTLALQPIVRSTDGALVGFSATPEWHSAEHGRLRAREFVDLAEHSRQVIPLGSWLIDAAVRAHADFQARSSQPLVLSIPVTPTEVERAHIAEDLAKALVPYPDLGKSVRVEIPAEALLDEALPLEAFAEALSKLGVSLHLAAAAKSGIPFWRARRLGVTGATLDFSKAPDVDQRAIDAALTALRAVTQEVVIESVDSEDRARLARGTRHNIWLRGDAVGAPMLIEEAHAALPSTAAASPARDDA